MHGTIPSKTTLEAVRGARATRACVPRPAPAVKTVDVTIEAEGEERVFVIYAGMDPVEFL